MRASLQRVGVARSSWHYHIKGRPRVANPIPQSQRKDPRALSRSEQDRIGALIQQEWTAGNSVMEGFAKAWDRGEYIASPRSWYRVATRLNQELRPTNPARKKRSRPETPEVQATGPNQVWAWDITDLLGPFRSTKYKAYCVQDLYSRRIVAHSVQHREEDSLAVDMFEKAFGHLGVPGHLHADNGAAMRSNALADLCGTTGVGMSFIRPSVSNDNAFKESEFRTMKHRPGYPKFFQTIEEATAWMDEYVHWFNNEHHHSSLAWHTPQSVYDGTWEQAHQARVKTLNQHYNNHPHRYNKKPETSRPAPLVGINLHKTKQQR